MITILGFSIPLPSSLEFLATPLGTFIANILAWILIAFATNYILSTIIRWAFRRFPGEVEDIVLGIIHRPLIITIIIYGTLYSLPPLNLPDSTAEFIRRVAYTILILIVLQVLWRVIKNVIVFYGERWARKTEGRVDDVLVPILNLFGPLFILINAALLILPMWGVDINSILVGAGVVGLVLGLALQDTLSNLFSGISLLVETPFRTGDLITLSDGRTCEVEKFGLRSTQLYSVDEHATVYVPNRNLSSDTLTNITKPTWEQRLSIEFNLGENVDMALVQQVIIQIAMANPCVLVPEMAIKLPLLRQQIETIRKRAADTSSDALRQLFLLEAEKYEQSIPRLEHEDRFNKELSNLIEALRAMVRGIQTRESDGLSTAELQEIYCKYVGPVDGIVEKVQVYADEWASEHDPWLTEKDCWDKRKLWFRRNEQLQIRWDKLKKEVNHPREHMELQLDELTKSMIDWLAIEYKILPEVWKIPDVVFKEFDGAGVNLELRFYVDNVRLEHDGRGPRVRTEIARHCRESLGEMGIWPR